MLNMNNIQEALKNYRLRNRLTYRELASRAGIPVATIFPIVKGDQMPNELTRYTIEINIPDLYKPHARG
jgi:transcriptional regulator with XRE-family HTH domain